MKSIAENDRCTSANVQFDAQNAAGVPALAACGLHATLGGREVLCGIDLTLPRGQWTSIVGPNGAGKSTLLRALAGLQPCSGQVLLAGTPLAQLRARERARRLGWMAQSGGADAAAADDFLCYDLAMLGRLPYQRWLASPSRADHEAVERALRQMQAWSWRERTLGQLSGGERQRVLLARLLAGEAELLLMDEPLANLDPPHQADWVQTVRAWVAQGGTVLSVLHELTFALAADAVVVIEQGRVRHHGRSEDPGTHAAIEAVFGQRVRIERAGGQWVALPVARVPG